MASMSCSGQVRQQHAHFALWALLKAPLLIGTDLRALSADSLAVLKVRCHLRSVVCSELRTVPLAHPCIANWPPLPAGDAPPCTVHSTPPAHTLIHRRVR